MAEENPSPMQEYDAFPAALKRYLSESDFHAISESVTRMNDSGIFGTIHYPSCNAVQYGLWKFATNGSPHIPDEDGAAILEFMNAFFPRPYLEEMEGYRPGTLNTVMGEE